MNYVELSDRHCEGIRRDRIIALEGEHYRLALMLEESIEPDEAATLLAQQGELERRIQLHAIQVPGEDTACRDQEESRT